MLTNKFAFFWRALPLKIREKKRKKTLEILTIVKHKHAQNFVEQETLIRTKNRHGKWPVLNFFLKAGMAFKFQSFHRYVTDQMYVCFIGAHSKFRYAACVLTDFKQSWSDMPYHTDGTHVP